MKHYFKFKHYLHLKLWLLAMILLTGQQAISQTAPPTSNGTGSGYISNVEAVTSGACVVSTINGNNQFWDVAQGNTYTITLSGVTDCANGGTDASIEVIVKSSISGNTCATASLVSTGVYAFNFTMPANACATFPIVYCTSGCSPSTGMFAQDNLLDGLGHLRTTYFNGSCVRVETDNDCENLCTFTTDITGDTVICNGETTQLCAGAGDDYLWNTGETSACINVTDAGIYSVVVFDANGCTAEASTEVIVNTPPTVEITPTGPTTVCSPSCVLLSASGASTYVWSPNGESTDQISACDGGSYSVVGTDGNGCTAASAPIDVTINTPPTVEVTPSDPDPVCEGTCVVLTASGAESYVWSNDSTTASIEVCETGTYSVIGTDANGCTAASAEVTVTINPLPTCSIPTPTPPVFGLPNNPLSAIVTCPAGCTCTYLWSVSSSDNSWTIPGAKNGTSILYTAGNNGTTGHFTFTITCLATGCSSTCQIDVTSLALESCSYTQGFYGNGGKAKCLGNLPSNQVIYMALNNPNCNPLVIGYGTRTITFGCNDTACINLRLPAGQTPAVLPASATCLNPTSSTVGSNGQYKNVFIGQVLTLSLNVRLFPGLGSIPITSSTFTTYKATACINGNAVAGTAQTYTIPQDVINCLGANNTVNDLLLLANKKLGNQTLCSAVSIGEINDAVDAVNRGFDECRLNSTNTIRMAESTTTGGSVNLKLNLFPNPSNGEATIEFMSADAQHAVIDIYNMNGSLAAHLFDSEVPSNSTNQINFNTGELLPGIYFIRVTNGDQSAYTRMVIIK